MEEFSVILFYSNNYATWTARILRNAGFYYKLISIPRYMSSDCGYCVKIRSMEKKAIEELIINKKVEYDRFESLRNG